MYVKPYGAVNLGIGGDEVQHVLWRVQNGAVDFVNPKVVVLLIGTNNIGNSGHDPTQVADGIRKLLQELSARLPQSRILLLGVFPRDEFSTTPFRSAVEKLNVLIRSCGDGERIMFLDISKKFLLPDGKISAEVMPDFLHLSFEAYRIWADAMQPLLTSLMT